eukprot:jgi/Chlat1/2978/Chrsp2S04699
MASCHSCCVRLGLLRLQRHGGSVGGQVSAVYGFPLRHSRPGEGPVSHAWCLRSARLQTRAWSGQEGFASTSGRDESGAAREQLTDAQQAKAAKFQALQSQVDAISAADRAQREWEQQDNTPEQQRAKKDALAMLNRRALSKAELENKLRSKGHEASATSAAVAMMQTHGFLNDTAYASSFVRQKWRSTKWSAYRLRQGLKAKGIAGKDADDALTELFGENQGRVMSLRQSPDLEEQQAQPFPPLVCSTRPEEQLLEAALKQWTKSAGKDVEKRKQRLIGWLQRRGHSWAIISQILQQVPK